MSRIRWKPKGDNIRKGFLAAVQFGLGERTMKRELYYNGKILTMQGQETAEAVLVEDGVGSSTPNIRPARDRQRNATSPARAAAGCLDS